MADQKRESKGSKTGGQFAADVNPESTLALAPEAPAKPRKGKQVYFTVFYDEVTRTWHEDPEYMREGQHVYDNARNNGDWEPIGEHEDLSREAFSSLRAKLFGNGPTPSKFDAEITALENEIASRNAEISGLDEQGDEDEVIDLQTEIIQRQESIARLQRSKIAALEKLSQGFNLNESICNQILDTVDEGYDPVLRGQVSALVDQYFDTYDPGDIKGLFDLISSESDYFMDHFDRDSMTLRDL